MPGRVLNIRPGLIVGPHDPSDRFTYWPVRVARGGELLAPGRPERPVQIIDVRDLAEWTVGMIEARSVGVYNATGPEQPLPMGQLLEICRQVSGSQAAFTWVNEDFLLAQEVKPWTELPLWLPESDAAAAGLSTVDCRKAMAAGLTFRPVAETVAATLAWSATRPDDYRWRAGLAAGREQALLAAWQQAPETLS
jgi:2'-hydroxyisoflavone reductase